MATNLSLLVQILSTQLLTEADGTCKKVQLSSDLHSTFQSPLADYFPTNVGFSVTFHII